MTQAAVTGLDDAEAGHAAAADFHFHCYASAFVPFYAAAVEFRVVGVVVVVVDYDDVGPVDAVLVDSVGAVVAGLFPRVSYLAAAPEDWCPPVPDLHPAERGHRAKGGRPQAGHGVGWTYGCELSDHVHGGHLSELDDRASDRHRCACLDNVLHSARWRRGRYPTRCGGCVVDLEDCSSGPVGGLVAEPHVDLADEADVNPAGSHAARECAAGKGCGSERGYEGADC